MSNLCKPVTIRNKTYPSISEAGRALKVDRTTVIKAIRRGTIDYVGTGVCGPKPTPIEINGVRYRDVKTCARALGRGYTTIYEMKRTGRKHFDIDYSKIGDFGVDIDVVINRIIKAEGRYSNVEHDRGGETKYGITKQSWHEYCDLLRYRRSPVKDIPIASARAFYKVRFRNAKITDLPKKFWHSVADAQVMSGSHGIKLFQRALNTCYKTTLECDGVIGPLTVDVAKRHKKGTKLFDLFASERVLFVSELVANDPTQAKFLVGWVNRINKFYTFR